TLHDALPICLWRAASASASCSCRVAMSAPAAGRPGLQKKEAPHDGGASLGSGYLAAYPFLSCNVRTQHPKLLHQSQVNGRGLIYQAVLTSKFVGVHVEQLSQLGQAIAQLLTVRPQDICEYRRPLGRYSRLRWLLAPIAKRTHLPPEGLTLGGRYTAQRLCSVQQRSHRDAPDRLQRSKTSQTDPACKCINHVPCGHQHLSCEV